MALAVQPDHFEVLRIGEGATPDQIEHSYHLLMRRFALSEADSQAEEAGILAVHARIEAARAALANVATRDQYVEARLHDKKRGRQEAWRQQAGLVLP